MSPYTRTYYIKTESYPTFRWIGLHGATSVAQAQQLADQNPNLGEIGMLHLPFGIEVISKKNAKGDWEDAYEGKNSEQMETDYGCTKEGKTT